VGRGVNDHQVKNLTAERRERREKTKFMAVVKAKVSVIPVKTGIHLKIFSRFSAFQSRNEADTADAGRVT
jgi:hypothetical protein